jgi:integrase/recombinase XerD
MGWNGEALPKEQVPAVEVSNWKARTGPSGILAHTGPAANWRDATINFNWRVYLLYLGWLAYRGSVVESSAIGSRMTHELIIEFIEEMRRRGNAAATILMRVLALERVLAVLAPSVDRAELRLIVRNLPEGRNASAKRARLQETAVLVDLGIALMMHVEKPGTRLTRQLATMFRDGLQIALLALRPFRRGNFTALEIGRHLVRRGNDWWLIIDADETKNGLFIEVQFPDDLVPWLEKYLHTYRPLLAGSKYQGQALWVSYWYTAQDDTGVYDRIVKRTGDVFTHAVNPHLFRHCLATSLAINDPEIIGIAHVMLGNDPATCQRDYNMAQMHVAGTRLGGTVGTLRERLRVAQRRCP